MNIKRWVETEVDSRLTAHERENDGYTEAEARFDVWVFLKQDEYRDELTDRQAARAIALLEAMGGFEQYKQTLRI